MDPYLNFRSAQGVTRDGFAMSQLKSRKGAARPPHAAAKLAARTNNNNNGHGSTGTQADADEAIAGLPQFEISGKSLRVLLIDDAPPRRTVNGGQPAVTYVPGEVVHFEFSGHRYALVSDAASIDHEPACDEQAPAPGVTPDVHALTNRELQIVQLICMGYLTKQVAGRLKLSEFTVRSYLKTVYCKLSVRSRGAMVYRYAQTFLNASQQLQSPDPPARR